MPLLLLALHLRMHAPRFNQVRNDFSSSGCILARASAASPPHPPNNFSPSAAIHEQLQTTLVPNTHSRPVVRARRVHHQHTALEHPPGTVQVLMLEFTSTILYRMVDAH